MLNFRDMLNFLFCDVAFSFVMLLFLLILDEFSDDKFKTLTFYNFYFYLVITNRWNS